MPAQTTPRGDVGFEPLFPRAHKFALGLAVGLTAGLGLFLLTAFHEVLGPGGPPLGLLNQYFVGYSVSWPGALVGFAWGFVTGFIGGWLLGFVHNFTVGVWVLFVRAKHDLSQTKNFLDHI